MHSLLNLYPWYLPRRNRELRTHLDLMGLSAVYPEMSFSLARSIPAAAVGNAVWLAQYALGRSPLGRSLLHRSYIYHAATKLNWLPRGLVRRLKPDLLFGHEYLPFNLSSRDLPVVFETAAVPEEVSRHYRPFYTPQQIQAHIGLNTRLKYHAVAQATLVNFREPYGAGQFRSQFPELAHKVRAVPPFLDYISPLPFERVAGKHADAERIKLLFVGNDARRKGLPVLVAAIRRLPREAAARLDVTIVSQFLDGAVDTEGIDAKVISGGRITLREALGRRHAAIKQGPLTVDEVLALMAGSHIFVMPTLADTFGFVYLEAMANGCAVIGPDRQPQTWILGDGRAGMIVDPTSAPALANAIELLIVNQNSRTDMALGAWRRYRSTFAAPVVAAQYRCLFEEAIELHKAGNAVTHRSRAASDCSLLQAG
jgi:glycosyltransferase involved in cell wall biosynthesis